MSRNAGNEPWVVASKALRLQEIALGMKKNGPRCEKDKAHETLKTIYKATPTLPGLTRVVHPRPTNLRLGDETSCVSLETPKVHE